MESKLYKVLDDREAIESLGAEGIFSKGTINQINNKVVVSRELKDEKTGEFIKRESSKRDIDIPSGYRAYLYDVGKEYNPLIISRILRDFSKDLLNDNNISPEVSNFLIKLLKYEINQEQNHDMLIPLIKDLNVFKTHINNNEVQNYLNNKYSRILPINVGNITNTYISNYNEEYQAVFENNDLAYYYNYISPNRFDISNNMINYINPIDLDIYLNNILFNELNREVVLNRVHKALMNNNKLSSKELKAIELIFDYHYNQGNNPSLSIKSLKDQYNDLDFISAKETILSSINGYNNDKYYKAKPYILESKLK